MLLVEQDDLYRLLLRSVFFLFYLISLNWWICFADKTLDMVTMMLFQWDHFLQLHSVKWSVSKTFRSCLETLRSEGPGSRAQFLLCSTSAWVEIWAEVQESRQRHWLARGGGRGAWGVEQGEPRSQRDLIRAEETKTNHLDWDAAAGIAPLVHTLTWLTAQLERNPTIISCILKYLESKWRVRLGALNCSANSVTLLQPVKNRVTVPSSGCDASPTRLGAF